MSFFPPQAFFDCSFPHQLRPCHKYESKSMYLHVLMKYHDEITVQNVKMGKGNILFHLVLFFMDTLDTCFGVFCWCFFFVIFLFVFGFFPY